MSEAPIACSLNPVEQAQRLRATGAIANDSMLEATLTRRGASMRFRAEAESELRDLIAAESKCCSFLAFDLRTEGSALRLRVEGPEGTRPMILKLFDLDPAG